MTEEKIGERNIAFSVDGHLLRELGERLVARPSIALAELVKNSFDADATEVILRFKNIKKTGGTIEIEDNGHGMSIDVIEKTWMRIATRDKRVNPRSPLYNRIRAGEKGVGRFACQILADELHLESVSQKKKGKEKISAVFVWENFWDRKRLEDTRVKFEVRKVSEKEPPGTKLTLIRTKKEWSKKDIGSMRRDILSLINPFSWEKNMKLQEGQGVDPGFNVVFEIPEFEEFTGGFSSRYLDAAWCMLHGQVDNGGKVEYRIRTWQGAKDTLHHPFDKPFTIGPIGFRIYWFKRESDEYKELEFGISDIRKASKEYGGVRIYYDDFRVFPYGERGNDWLGIDRDKGARIDALPKTLEKYGKELFRPMLLVPGNNQLVGAVFLSRENNPDIIISVSRDKLVENDAFLELNRIVKTAIQWMTIIYARETEDRRRTSRKSKTQSTTTLNQIIDFVEEAKKTADTEEKAETLRVIQDLVVMLEDEIEEQKEEIIAVVDLYQILASTGTLVGILSHELIALKEAIEKARREIEGVAREVPISARNKLKRTARELQIWHVFIDELSDAVRQLLSKDSRDQKIRQAVRESVDVIAGAFSSYCEHNSIVIRNNIPATITTPPMFLAQLYSIIINLLTNSIKWVMFKEDRRIKLEGRIKDGGIEIKVFDSGPGVAKEIREKVFEPFVSYSSPNLELGTGTGLGLTIVRNFVSDANGDVRFIDPPDGWGCCCVIRFEDE